MQPVSEKAIDEADFWDLVPIDKARLLTKAYSILWQQLVLEPLFEANNCRTEEEQRMFISQPQIQDLYSARVKMIRNEMKQGELDDQEHFMEDLTDTLTLAIQEAAKTFKRTK